MTTVSIGKVKSVTPIDDKPVKNRDVDVEVFLLEKEAKALRARAVRDQAAGEAERQALRRAEVRAERRRAERLEAEERADLEAARWRERHPEEAAQYDAARASRRGAAAGFGVAVVLGGLGAAIWRAAQSG